MDAQARDEIDGGRDFRLKMQPRVLRSDCLLDESGIDIRMLVGWVTEWCGTRKLTSSAMKSPGSVSSGSGHTLCRQR